MKICEKCHKKIVDEYDQFKDDEICQCMDWEEDEELDKKEYKYIIWILILIIMVLLFTIVYLCLLLMEVI